MARLIVKSPYIKCGGGQSAGGYMKYIATRERVEIIPDDRPPTRKQEQLITKLVKDFPDTKNLLEYEDYAQHPTKANASSLITLALEENWSQVQPRKAMPSTSLPGPALSVWVTMDYLAMKMAWIWTKPCLNWSTTQEMFGRTSFRSIGRTLSAWAITTPRRGVLSCVHTAMTLPPP